MLFRSVHLFPSHDTLASARNYNYQMALFNSTGYGAQMEQMKNAGLNPALMYAKGGNPGQTNAQPGSVNANAAQPQQGLMSGLSNSIAKCGGMESLLKERKKSRYLRS